jgi:ABC-2 type transport system ATP-binding protein
MDEAERCHRLAYIVNGKLMTEGTIADIIQHVALTAYAGTGEQLVKVVEALSQKSGVEQATALGNQIRICGTDSEALRASIAEYPAIDWKKVEANLEEVFIHLVKERTNDAI